MDWGALEAHFGAATRQIPSPAGDDAAIEWDYSRISRALGFSGSPSLDGMPFSGAAILGLRQEERSAARRRYFEWAELAGWRFLSVCAQPGVGVPDPLVYTLGEWLAGPDSLIFCRTKGVGRPPLGKRPRSAGCSIPLTPGERWAIAADRVRRRCRVAMAEKGLVLFIDGAEHLTPLSAGLLAHFLNAHRAWRGRLLARPARFYVALVASPSREPIVRDLLERLDVTGEIALQGGEEQGTDSPPALGVEEEHVLAALADAPVAISEDDVSALFGDSGKRICARFEEQGLVARRREAGLNVLVPTVPSTIRLLEPPPRVRRAILDRYRAHVRKGRDHVAFGASLLAFRLGERLRGVAHLSAAGPGEPLALSSIHFRELEEHLAAARTRLRCSDFALWFALNAHQRRYDCARELAQSLVARELRSQPDLARTVVHVLCVGRGHLDRALPDGFWSDLTSSRIDRSLLDATCILSDLFARMRLMPDKEILARFEVATLTCSRLSAERGAAQWRQLSADSSLVELLQALELRVAIYVATQLLPNTTLPNAARQMAALDVSKMDRTTPAYVLATLAFADVQVHALCSHPTCHGRNRTGALDLMRVTGNHHDALISLSAYFKQLKLRGVRLLLR
ncbi:MAG: hypothetical protein ACREI7_02175, partial [Myxococcota bacterium]